MDDIQTSEEPASDQSEDISLPPLIAVPRSAGISHQEEELPVSSPAPNAYTALSDSYLFSGRPGDDSSEGKPSPSAMWRCKDVCNG